MLPSSIGGAIRHTLTFAGGIAVTYGWTDEVAIEAVIGAVLTLVGFAWSIYRKWVDSQ